VWLQHRALAHALFARHWTPGAMGLLASLLLAAVCFTAGGRNEVAQVQAEWSGLEPSVQILGREYSRIFRTGNRNAASHLWVRFLLERSSHLTHTSLTSMFSGFCAVSGSPVRSSDYNRYRLSLDNVDGSGKVSGFMHYCCWPCVCDTQDFIRVDTRNVTTADGEHSYRFAVIGNPCDRAEELHRPFQDAFGRGESTLQRDAPEVRCGDDGELLGAPLSDHGYVIIGMFFEDPAAATMGGAVLAPAGQRVPNPGRISEAAGIKFQDETEFGPMCEERKRGGFKSGMGEIFRRVASIAPIQIPAALTASSDNATACPTIAGPEM